MFNSLNYFATETLRQTKMLTHVQYLLGHKSIVNTERYVHLARATPQLIAQLNALPKISTKVFGDSWIDTLKIAFLRLRKKQATKMQNPRLLSIDFHTLDIGKPQYCTIELKILYTSEIFWDTKASRTLKYT